MYKISGVRETENKFSFRSLALSLYKISGGSAISSLVKLCFPNLLLHSLCIIFVKDKLRSGKKGKVARPHHVTKHVPVKRAGDRNHVFPKQKRTHIKT